MAPYDVVGIRESLVESVDGYGTVAFCFESFTNH